MVGVKQWKVIVKRDREAELLFRGDQIRRAIGLYLSKPGAKKFPTSLEDLMGDGANNKNHLRRLYKDPITNADFELLGVNNSLIGVRSTSEEEPLKTGNFPPPYECFEQANTYRDWVFVYLKTVSPRPPSRNVKPTAKRDQAPQPFPQGSPCDAVAHLKVIKKNNSSD